MTAAYSNEIYEQSSRAEKKNPWATITLFPWSLSRNVVWSIADKSIVRNLSNWAPYERGCDECIAICRQRNNHCDWDDRKKSLFIKPWLIKFLYNFSQALAIKSNCWIFEEYKMWKSRDRALIVKEKKIISKRLCSKGIRNLKSTKTDIAQSVPTSPKRPLLFLSSILAVQNRSIPRLRQTCGKVRASEGSKAHTQLSK